MTAFATRALKGLDTQDIVAVKVDSETYKGKSGVIKVVVSSVGVTNGSAAAMNVGRVDLRVPQFAPLNDVPLIDRVPLTNTVTATVPLAVTTYYFAVNNGIPGPAVFVQGDGSWDLLWLKLELNQNLAITNGIVATANVTISFTDLTTYDYSAASAGSLTLDTNDLCPYDYGIGAISGASFTLNGAVSVLLTSLTVVGIDNPQAFQPLLNAPPIVPSPEGDSVPLFSVINAKTPSGYGAQAAIVSHPTTKNSGIRNYPTDRRIIIASNSGVLDGNGNNCKNSPNNNSKEIFVAVLARQPEWPTNDDVSATLAYKYVQHSL